MPSFNQTQNPAEREALSHLHEIAQRYWNLIEVCKHPIPGVKAEYDAALKNYVPSDRPGLDPNRPRVRKDFIKFMRDSGAMDRNIVNQINHNADYVVNSAAVSSFAALTGRYIDRDMETSFPLARVTRDLSQDLGFLGGQWVHSPKDLDAAIDAYAKAVDTIDLTTLDDTEIRDAVLALRETIFPAIRETRLAFDKAAAAWFAVYPTPDKERDALHVLCGLSKQPAHYTSISLAEKSPLQPDDIALLREIAVQTKQLHLFAQAWQTKRGQRSSSMREDTDLNGMLQLIAQEPSPLKSLQPRMHELANRLITHSEQDENRPPLESTLRVITRNLDETIKTAEQWHTHHQTGLSTPEQKQRCV